MLDVLLCSANHACAHHPCTDYAGEIHSCPNNASTHHACAHHAGEDNTCPHNAGTNHTGKDNTW